MTAHGLHQFPLVRFACLFALITGLVVICASAETSVCKPPEAKQPGTSLRPQVLYTDIASGPTTGGESDLGIYLSIFGVHFWDGPTIDAAFAKNSIKVFIGGHQAAAYRYFGVSSGRPDIQQITVQIGHLHRVAHGVPLSVVVEVAGKKSNKDIQFIPNPGSIYFIDNVNGADATGRVGDIAHPFQCVQSNNPSKGCVWPSIKPGDFIVMRGKGRLWQDTGVDGYFVRFQKSGTPPSGRRGSGAITLMGYPGEDVFIDETYSISKSGAIAGINGPHGRIMKAQNARKSPADNVDRASICEQNRSSLCSQWITVAGLRVEGGGNDGAINLEIGGNHWRVINNILSASTAHEAARSGGITGDGLDAVVLGNTVRDINSPDPGLQNHGIYIDGPGSYRVEYNYIHDVPGGSGFQVYGDETPTGSYIANDVVFAHNWIQNVAKYCINLADNSGSNFAVYDNVSAHCGMAGLRINSPFLHEAHVYNNTFYAGDSLGKADFGVIVLDARLQPDALDVRNNIFMPLANMPYMGGDNPLLGPSGSAHFSNNQYFGGVGEHPFDPTSSTTEPAFVDAHSCNFRLQTNTRTSGDGSSSVRAIVRNDFDFVPYLLDHRYSIGAYAHDND